MQGGGDFVFPTLIQGSVSFIGLFNDEKLIAASSKGEIKIISSDLKSSGIIGKHASNVRKAVLTSNGLVMSASIHGRIKGWDPVENTNPSSSSKRLRVSGGVRDFCESIDRKSLLIGNERNTIIVCEMDSLSVMQSLSHKRLRGIQNIIPIENHSKRGYLIATDSRLLFIDESLSIASLTSLILLSPFTHLHSRCCVCNEWQLCLVLVKKETWSHRLCFNIIDLNDFTPSASFSLKMKDSVISIGGVDHLWYIANKNCCYLVDKESGTLVRAVYFPTSNATVVFVISGLTDELIVIYYGAEDGTIRGIPVIL